MKSFAFDDKNKLMSRHKTAPVKTQFWQQVLVWQKQIQSQNQQQF
jgi:hypothetical protein